MNSPYSHSPAADEASQPIPGYVSRSASVFFALLFALVALLTLLRLRLVLIGHPEAENVIGIVVGSGIWLAGLAAITAFLWRVSNHFLHPNTHGFGIIHRENAQKIVRKHSDLNLASVSLPDDSYGRLTLRELLQVYSLMDHTKNPERLTALVATMQSHTGTQSGSRGG